MKNTYKILLAGVCLTTLAPNAYAARSGILDFFFPTLREYAPDPSQTLKAPFADGVKDGTQAEGGNIEEFQVPSPDNTVPLHKQHRVNNEIITWLDRKIPELLNLTRTDYSKQLQDIKPLFTPTAWDQYVDFLAKFGVAQVLKEGTHDTQSFTEAPPSVLNQATLEGRYAWVFKTPVILSFMKGESNDYKDLQVYNRNISLIIQVGRHAQAPEPGVLIERWEATEVVSN